MKYCIIYHNNEDICDIIVEDGGVAAVHTTGEKLVVSLYGDRVSGMRELYTSFFDTANITGLADFDLVHYHGGKISEDLLQFCLDWLIAGVDFHDWIEVEPNEVFK